MQISSRLHVNREYCCKRDKQAGGWRSAVKYLNMGVMFPDIHEEVHVLAFWSQARRMRKVISFCQSGGMEIFYIRRLRAYEHCSEVYDAILYHIHK